MIADGFHEVTPQRRPLDTDGVRAGDGPGAARPGRATTCWSSTRDLLYTNTGEGLHRFVDPVDGEVYLYSQFETADAKRMYACFDQPDLKGTFTLTVTAPAHWRSSPTAARSRSSDDDGDAHGASFAHHPAAQRRT